MEENLREIYSADKMYKINLIQEMLDENNIEHFILNQKGSALLLGDIHLYVDEKNESKALAIIKDHDL